MGVCRPVLQILTQFHTPKLTFSTPVFRPGVGRNYVIIKANSDTVRTSTWCSHKWESEIAGVYFSQTTEIYFLKIHLEFAYYSFFLIPLKRQIRSCIPSKTIPVFRPKRRKNHILWGTPPPPHGYRMKYCSSCYPKFSITYRFVTFCAEPQVSSRLGVGLQNKNKK